MKLRNVVAASSLVALAALVYASQVRAEEEYVEMPMESPGCATCGGEPAYMAAPSCGCPRPCGCHWWNSINLDPLGVFHCKKCCQHTCGCQPTCEAMPACGCETPCGCAKPCCHRPYINLDPLGLFHCQRPSCGCACGGEPADIVQPACGCGGH